jgi:hypothetical protein
MADANKTAWASYDRVRAALVKATARLILDRDCLYEGITTSEGDILDEQDREDLADADALIDECQTALDGPIAHPHTQRSRGTAYRRRWPWLRNGARTLADLEKEDEI